MYIGNVNYLILHLTPEINTLTGVNPSPCIGTKPGWIKHTTMYRSYLTTCAAV